MGKKYFGFSSVLSKLCSFSLELRSIGQIINNKYNIKTLFRTQRKIRGRVIKKSNFSDNKKKKIYFD